MKWFDNTKIPKVTIPIIFVVGDEEIEGWYIFNWNKREFQYCRQKHGSTGGWIVYNTEDVIKWRYFGDIKKVQEG